MDWILTFLVWCISLLVPVLLVLYRWRQWNVSPGQLPPGPPGWPVFGNMFDLGPEAHKKIGGLKQDYGPVVWLRLGSVNTVALLTAKAAVELFKYHDSSFAERRITDMMEAQGFNQGSVSLSPYGPHWRLKKRIMTLEMLGHKMMSETEPIRRRCVLDMVEWIRKAGASGRTIHVGRFVFLASFNMVGNLMLSQDLVGPESEESSEFFTAMVELLESTAYPNVVDLFPWLKWLDPQGLRRTADRGVKRTLKIIAGFVLERRLKHRRGTQSNKDFLEVLLEHQGNGISDHGLSILILVTN